MLKQTNSFSAQKSYQIDALDGLRGLAVLIVVVSHISGLGVFLFPSFDIEGTGKSGVFLFFILSAYLLTRPLIDVFQQQMTVQYMLNYGLRRILRIFPLYILYLLLAVITTLYVDVYIQGGIQAYPFDLDWAGFWQHLFLQDGKFVTWSIPAEFKFYFVLPLMAYLYAKALAYRYVGIAALTAGLWAALYLYRHILGLEWELLHSVTYGEIFIMGSYAAAIKSLWDKTPISLASRKMISGGAIMAVIALVLTIPSLYSALFEPVHFRFMQRNMPFYAVSWFFILLAILHGGIFINTLLSQGWLRFVGAISFSIYLIHAPVILVISLFEFNNYIAAWLILAVTIIISTFTYYLIERPISKLKLPLAPASLPAYKPPK